MVGLKDVIITICSGCFEVLSIFCPSHDFNSYQEYLIVIIHKICLIIVENNNILEAVRYIEVTKLGFVGP